MTSIGDFKFNDSLIARTSFLPAVAVKVTTGVDGNVAHKIVGLKCLKLYRLHLQSFSIIIL